MTDYYYNASDKPLHLVEGQLDAWYTEGIEDFIDEFDVPIQLEMYSPEIEKALYPLYLFIKSHFERHTKCTVQIANYLNSSIEDCNIHKKKTIHIKELTEPRQLLLETGELLTIKQDQ